MTAKTVTVTLPAGTRVTCSEKLAESMGIAEKPKAPAKKATSKPQDK